jgi:hypothetical protein
MENGRPRAANGPHTVKYEVRIGGKPRVVELTRNSETWKISLDGKVLDVDAVEIATNTFSILIEGESHEVRVALLPDQARALDSCHAQCRKGYGAPLQRRQFQDHQACVLHHAAGVPCIQPSIALVEDAVA